MVPGEGLSDTDIYLAVATIAVFGIGGQWIGRRLGFPSLLPLLPLGLLAGDVLGLVEPEALLGDLLFPTVSLLVALLLFQSGLQLRFADLPDKARSPVIRLITVGAAITLVGASLAALAILGLDVGLAFLLGAIIVTSGPTVVGPLLSSVRPRAPDGSVLNYEGTFLDPIGATLGVVVLTVVLASDPSDVHPVLYFIGRLGLGVAIGLAAAAAMVVVMSRFWLTYKVEAAVAVMFAIVAFVGAEVLLSESGMFAALTLGVALANQRRVSLKPARIFGETLELLIIAALFILLGARDGRASPTAALGRSHRSSTPGCQDVLAERSVRDIIAVERSDHAGAKGDESGSARWARRRSSTLPALTSGREAIPKCRHSRVRPAARSGSAWHFRAEAYAPPSSIWVR